MQDEGVVDKGESHLCHQFIAIARACERAILSHCNDRSITFQEYIILSKLSTTTQIAEAELLAALDVDRHVLTPLLNRMERHGWIYRTEMPGDRRKKMILPMARAERFWTILAAARNRVDERLQAALDPHQRVAVETSLISVAKALTEGSS